jgi:hypothetical protein
VVEVCVCVWGGGGGGGCMRGVGTCTRVMVLSADVTLLPTAATCFNSLTLPQYQSKKQLREKLLQAILYGGQGFLTQ